MIKFCRYFSLLLLYTFFYFSAFSQNCTVNAGVATTICPGSAFVLSGSASGLFASGGTAVWSQISGPAITLSATTISGSTATATVTGYSAGSVYGFRLTGKCTDGSLVYQDVLYTASNATATNAGPDIVACPGTISMAANALASGETGSWTLVSGVSTTLPSPSTSPTATLTLPATTSIGATTYRWTVVNGNCTSYDDVIVTNRGGISPVSAGPNQTVGCYATTAGATLAASFAGNGTGNQLGTWSLVSGPSTPTFGNIHTNNTTVSNLIQGTYKLRWTVTGVCASGTADMTITVPAGTQGVTNVPASATNIYYCDGRASTSLTAPTPNYTNETAAWTQTATQANAGVTISNPSSPTTTITGLNGTTMRSFTYTITNNVTGCSNSAVYNIYFSVAPSVTVNGGSPNFLVACDVVTASVPYTVAGGNLTQWALVSGPAGSTLGGSTGTSNYTTASSSPQTIAGLTVAGTYVIRFKRTTNNGSGSCSDAYQDVSINVTKSVTAANAGTKQVLACNTFSTDLQGNTPTNGSGKWTQLSGPNTATIADVTLANTGISGLVAGAYTFRWIISGGEGSCGNSQSDVSVIVASPTPTTSAAGSNMAACYATPVTLTGNQPASTETGTWTVTPSAGVVFNNIHDPNAIVTGLSNNTAYTFTWTITNSCGSSASSVTITTSNTAGAKQATAGADQCLSGGTTSFTLAGNAPATGETGVWTLLSGAPNTPTFTNAYNTTVSGAANGTYKFEWSLNKGGCTSTRDTVFITISSAATTANAGTTVTQCGFANITLSGNNPAVGTGTWTQTEGPGGAVITNPALRNTTVSGLVTGRYVFRWTITNGACSSNYAEVTVNISTPPTTASAGSDQSLCNTTSATLAANTITVGKGLWSVVSGPNTPTFASAANPTTTVSNLIMGTYVLRWTATNGLYCSPSTDDVNIYVTQNATAGANQSLCSQSSTVLTGNEGSSGTWNQVGTSPATATINANSNNTAIVTGLTTGGVYTFRYTIAAAGSCAQTTADMTVTVTPAPSAAMAGDDVNYCLAAGTGNASVMLGANSTAPTSGTGTWSVASKPTGSPTPAFSNVNNINATFSNLVNGLYILEWNVTNGGCTVNKDVVRVTIYGEPSAAAAGADQTSACSSQITLAATAPTVGIGTWSQTGGPTLPAGSIDAPNLPSTRILNTSAGNTYTFTWTVTNGNICSPKTDDVVITVVADAPTVANAGAAQSLCGQYTTTLAANTVASGETGTWTIISKPAGAADAVFANINNPTSDLNGLVQGIYTLRWTITNAGTCTSTADVIITVTNPPTTANAGADASYCLFSPVVLAATPITSGTGTWTVVSKPTSSPVPVFSSVNAANASLTGLVEGAYTFKWSSTNGSCPASDSQVNINIYKCEIGVTKTAGTPVLQADGSYNITFTFNVTNTGSATLNGVQVTDDLNASFTGKNFTISSKTASGALVINQNFNGTSDKNLLAAASSTLAASATGTIVLVVNIVL